MANSTIVWEVRILRLTRHAAEESQIRELKRKFGELVTISEVSETMPMEVKAFVARFDELANGYDVVEAVLPLNLLEAALKFSEFSKKGGKIIRSSMNRSLSADGSIYFTFDHYEVVKKVEVVTEAL